MRPFAYARATTASEAVQSFGPSSSTTRFLAGGTTLFDLMKLNVETPTRLVDINGISELAAFDTGGNDLVFGPLARMSDVAFDPTLVSNYPLIAEALWKAASGQVRNMASLGGNLLQRTRCAYFRHGEPFACNKRQPGSGCAAIGGRDRGHAVLGGSEACIATYPGDLAVALVALDAEIDILCPNGTRTELLEKLYLEPGDTPDRETTLAPGELIVSIRVPRGQAARSSTYHKIRDRESFAFAIASAAVALQLDGDVVRDARIALGGIATRPWRAREAERALIGATLTEGAASAAGELALGGARAGSHNAFRIELGARTVADALMIAKERA
ncbi:FAD binding domain-containing protein [Aurantimonas endophytica]|uniref:Xanthine dehydrogenase YagS FAD-binding subunit n=1 Tax=Aurantimonas endophytica TaxID=1522175 RepID=A0A7W6MS07_9HYPH|nr:xanthine dehydrogenase family protein subunit M [Aurantimonas endophytica]MBB4005538.1 xanthine dehydrogenase YagS FAD-binding subunit [Aurantimonas endophytica]MCO6406490.1 xanthine dehydrogenase family protein subunit M [Aurantimonas endophytica]